MGKPLFMVHPSDPGSITVDEIQTLSPESLTFIDVRKNPDGKQIRGSLRYDGKALLDAGELTLPLSHDGTIVVYCGSGNSSVAIAKHMREKGFANAVVLIGGYEAAKEAGLPMEELSREQPIPGQSDSGIRLL